MNGGQQSLDKSQRIIENLKGDVLVEIGKDRERTKSFKAFAHAKFSSSFKLADAEKKLDEIQFKIQQIERLNTLNEKSVVNNENEEDFSRATDL